MVDGAFDALCSHLERGHDQLGRLEKKMEKDRLTNGSLTEEKERNLEESRKAYEALLGNVTSLASSLNRCAVYGNKKRVAYLNTENSNG